MGSNLKKIASDIITVIGDYKKSIGGKWRKGDRAVVVDLIEKELMKMKVAQTKSGFAKVASIVPTERMVILGGCFNRRHDTAWSRNEIIRFEELNPAIDHCRLMAEFYSHRKEALKHGDTNVWKNDLVTLMNQWDMQLDRARSSNYASPVKDIKAIPPEPKDWVKKFMKLYEQNGWSAGTGWVRRDGDGKIFKWADLGDPYNLWDELI